MSYPRSLKFLKDAIAAEQCSAIALYTKIRGKEEFHYLGTTARVGSDVIKAPVGEHALFDLASLTKILSTLCLLLVAESEQRISFQDPVSKYFPKMKDKKITLTDLLQHSSGLPAHLKFYERFSAGEAKFGDLESLLSWISEAEISSEKNPAYSDLGFMLLGILLEKIYEKPLNQIFLDKISAKLKLQHTGFVSLPHSSALARMHGLLMEKKFFVATEKCPWRQKTLQGEVHDDNAWAMGGVAGHAGLFSTLAETKLCFEHLWRQIRANPLYKLDKPAANGANANFYLGLMRYPGLRPFPGNAFHGAYGHTGFVGTSAWHHPETDTSVILLSNRVHPTREDARWIDTRLQFHHTLWQETNL